MKKDASEQQIRSIRDRVECLHICAQEFQVKTIDGLKQAIESLFSDETGGITLATVHRTKGLETKRVFLLNPQKMPLEWEDQKPVELEQEWNILYVALTRATEELVILGSTIRRPNVIGGHTMSPVEDGNTGLGKSRTGSALDILMSFDDIFDEGDDHFDIMPLATGTPVPDVTCTAIVPVMGKERVWIETVHVPSKPTLAQRRAARIRHAPHRRTRKPAPPPAAASNDYERMRALLMKFATLRGNESYFSTANLRAEACKVLFEEPVQS